MPEQRRAHAAIARDARIRRRRRLLDAGERRRQVLEAVMTADFLDQIDLAVHVDAPGRRPGPSHLSASADVRTSKPSHVRMRIDLGVGHVMPSSPRDARARAARPRLIRRAGRRR